MNIKKYAAIDIDSNAMRLLITNILEYNKEVRFNKSEIIRVPIRLGQDAFTVGEISEKNPPGGGTNGVHPLLRGQIRAV